jgi:hypothetical protein
MGKPLKIIGKTLKYLVYAVILFVIALIIFRVYTMRYPKDTIDFITTQKVVDAYNAAPGDFRILRSDTKPNGTSTYSVNDGKFSVTGFYKALLDAETNLWHFQFTVRYNNSTVRALADDYGEEAAQTLGEPFVFILRDADGNLYRDYGYLNYSSWLYNYRQIIFDVNLPAENQDKDLFVCVYYIDDVLLSQNSAYDIMTLQLEGFTFGDYSFDPKSKIRETIPNPVYLIKDTF